MVSEVTRWREWELSAEWASSNICPNCGENLIITELISHTEETYYSTATTLYNGICPSCRKQYTIHTDAEALTVNVEAANQQDIICALESRVARLEAIVQKLIEQIIVPTRPPIPDRQEEEPDAKDFRKKYSYLF